MCVCGGGGCVVCGMVVVCVCYGGGMCACSVCECVLVWCIVFTYCVTCVNSMLIVLALYVMV